MAKKTKKSAKSKAKGQSSKGKSTPTEAKPRKGHLGEIFGYAVTAVLRKLGAEGVKRAHGEAIVKAQGIKMSSHSIDVQLGLGRTNARPVAPLTAAQVKELVDSAEAPETNGEAKPKAKAKAKSKATKSAKGGKGKSGSKKKGKEKPAETPEPETKPEQPEEEEEARVHSAEETA